MEGADDVETGAAGAGWYPVSELEPQTLLEVARRLDVARSFEDLVYRESELDALWTLADLQARQAELDGAREDFRRWGTVRDRLRAVHDLVPEGRCLEAAARLRDLASGLTAPG